MITNNFLLKLSLAYCDYIANEIKVSLETNKLKLLKVGKIQFDLGPNGEFLSTKKEIEVTDWNGKKYKIVISEKVGEK